MVGHNAKQYDCAAKLGRFEPLQRAVTDLSVEGNVHALAIEFVKVKMACNESPIAVGNGISKPAKVVQDMADRPEIIELARKQLNEQ